MQPYLFGVRNGIHIIDLTQSVPLLSRALATITQIVSGGGRVLFVGTKKQASEPIAQAAKRCAQYYVNSRWLGGTLTNWKTISNSIKRLRQLDLVARAVIEGLAKSQSQYGDVGAAAEPLPEEVAADEVLPEAALIDDPALAAEMGVLPEGDTAQAVA